MPLSPEFSICELKRHTDLGREGHQSVLSFSNKPAPSHPPPRGCIEAGSFCCAIFLRTGTQFPLALSALPWACWFLKSHVLSLADCKNSWNLAPLVFKVTCYANSSSLCRLPGMRVCFYTLSMPTTSLTPVDSSVGPFSSCPHLYLSYPFQCSLFFTFNYG